MELFFFLFEAIKYLSILRLNPFIDKTSQLKLVLGLYDKSSIRHIN